MTDIEYESERNKLRREAVEWATNRAGRDTELWSRLFLCKMDHLAHESGLVPWITKTSAAVCREYKTITEVRV